MIILKKASAKFDAQPRTIVCDVRSAVDGHLVTTTQGATYSDAERLANAKAFELGYQIDWSL